MATPGVEQLELTTESNAPPEVIGLSSVDVLLDMGLCARATGKYNALEPHLTKVAEKALAWTARYVEHLRQDSDTLRSSLLWSIVAESIGHCWFLIPASYAALFDICHGTVLLSDGKQYSAHPNELADAYKVTFCNLVGTCTVGAAVVFAQRWETPHPGQAPDGKNMLTSTSAASHAKWRMATAIRTGFCPCLSTFPGAVQVSVSLLRHKVAFFAFVSFVGGPALAGLGAVWALRALQLGGCWARFGEAFVARARWWVLLIISAAVAFEWQDKSELVSLFVGWFMAVAACLTADVLNLIAPSTNFRGINLVTVLSNIFAMTIVAGHRAGTLWRLNHASDGTDFFKVVSAKFETTYCGTVSAYSCFAGDVVSPLVFQGPAKGWRKAAANWFANVAVGLFFVRLYSISSLHAIDTGMPLASREAISSSGSVVFVNCSGFG